MILKKHVVRFVPPGMKAWAKGVEKRLGIRRWLQSREYARDTRTLSPERLREALRELGIVEGATVMIHASVDDLSRRVPDLNPLEVLRLVEELVGPEGTLVVPTFPFQGRQLDYVRSEPVFDVRRTPSQMGLLTEMFRRLPGAVRSLHPTHSVAARGPNAETLVSEHHLGSAFGKNSPFYKLTEVGGLVLGLGVEISRGYTILHCGEELDEAACAHFFVEESYPVQVRASGEETTVTVRPLRRGIRNGRRLQQILTERGIFQRREEEGLLLTCAPAKAFVDTHLEILRESPREYY